MSNHQLSRGQEWLEEILKLSGIPTPVSADDSTIENEGSCWLTIDATSLSSEQVQGLIGDRGLALDAIQYLANTTLNLNQAEDEQCAYTVELNGYRKQRQAELEAIATEAAQHVRGTGEEYEIPSLSAAERRQVHTLLQSYDDLATYSRGREPDRRLVVHPKQDDPEGSKSESPE
ncbi:MAG: R3H domain-containing nucleic acid-binding protein [Elainellaceae cyanobacterium]